MGFKSNQSEAVQGNIIKPEGDYECIITKIEERTTKNGAKGINFSLVIRNDIPEQKYKNAYLFHTIWRKKEPNELDMQVEGYNYAQLMAMGKAAALPDGKDYENLREYLNDLLNKCILATVRHEEYNGKPQERISYVNPTKCPNCSHKFKTSAPKADTYAAPQNAGFANTQSNASAMGSLANFEEAIGDDGVPF